MLFDDLSTVTGDPCQVKELYRGQRLELELDLGNQEITGADFPGREICSTIGTDIVLTKFCTVKLWFSVA